MLNEKDLKPADLAKEIGKDQSIISNWKKRKTDPEAKYIPQIAVFLGTSIDYLLTGEENNSIISEQDKKILSNYKLLNKAQQNSINFTIEQFLLIPNALDTEFSNIIDLKLFTQKASAGLGNYFALDDNEYTIRSFNMDDVPKGTEFCIIADGDSMLPTIKDQQILFIKPTPSINNNEIGIFIIDGEVFCKKLIIDSQSNAVFLRSINSKYPDIPIKEFNNIKTVGKVLL